MSPLPQIRTSWDAGMNSLWTASERADATAGFVHGDFEANGVAFDSREITDGDLFIAMKGEATDGHRFLGQAFAAGAAGAIVSEEIDQPQVHVADTVKALNDLGRASRVRTNARIAGVTATVGQTDRKSVVYGKSVGVRVNLGGPL